MRESTKYRNSINRRRFLSLAPLLAGFVGCRLFAPKDEFPIEDMVAELEPELISNPLYILPGDREFIHNQIVDELDNYFVIQREQRVQLVSNVLTEGVIQTRPRVGATFLEPFRPDSTTTYERALATLQSIRRTARARIIPTEEGTLLDLTVLKELEHMDRPVRATAGALIARHDSSLIREEVPPGTFSITPGWISLGRDVALEQRILNNLRGRLCDPATPAKRPAEGIFTDW